MGGTRPHLGLDKSTPTIEFCNEGRGAGLVEIFHPFDLGAVRAAYQWTDFFFQVSAPGYRKFGGRHGVHPQILGSMLTLRAEIGVVRCGEINERTCSIRSESIGAQI